ncbi:MAG TPA: cobalamin-dependent protein [Gemmatimonadaceae bacterium]|nr:cobalamin-dependent protein [Gemmatimonadaceae bacterium]
MPDAAVVRNSYLAALRAGDRRRAFAVVEDARGQGLDVAALYLDVLQQSLREVGRLWQENEMTVAEEHLATAITQMVMARVHADVAADVTQGARSLVAACADTERHDVGLRMVCDLLERDGWDVAYLGASVPAESLVHLVRERRPDAVALSASIAPHLPQLGTMIRCVREATGDAAPFILVGGRPFLDEPQLAHRLGADATAPDALAAVAILRERVA